MCLLAVSMAAAVLAGSSGSSNAAEAAVIDPATYQPTAPITAGFLYPWFPKAWTQGVFPFTNYTPSLGWYDSSDPATIDKQLALGADAGLEAFISSWWGPGHHTDKALPALLGRITATNSPAPTMRLAVYYEEEGQSNPSSAKIVDDLRYLEANYFSNSGYLRVNGKPVIFVWADPSDGADMATRWADAKTAFGGDVYVVLKVFSGYRKVTPQPDSWHQYGPAVAYSEQLPFSATVSPGFWLKGEAAPRLGRDIDRFRTDVKRMRDSGAFWQLVTSWNEWGEGTSVEPANEFGTAYVDALGATLGTTPAPTGTTTSAPSATTVTVAPGPPTIPSPTATTMSTVATSTGGSQAPTAAASGRVAARVDAYVSSARPLIQHGSALILRTDASPVRNAYISFTVPDGTAPTKAVLRLYPNNTNPAGVDVYSVADTTWGEASITYANAPAMGGKVASSGPVMAGQWVEIDVTSAVKAGAISLGLRTASGTSISFASREAGAAPELVLTGASEGVVPPTVVVAGPPTTDPSTPTVAAPVLQTTTSTSAFPTTAAPRAAGGSIVFSAGGDFGANANTTATLGAIARSGSAFHLALGDLSYSDLAEPAWCDYVKSSLGSTFPVELLVGNHEEDGGPDGYIGNFAACLPDRMGSTGTYAAEYYFDKGPARFILIGADTSVGGVAYDYKKGNAHYTWLSNAIDDARAKSIPWVIVGLHKDCLTAGQKGCEIGPDLMNLLITKRVDVVLHGHDHTYQRSKQLTCATAGVYQAQCVADDGADGAYRKGAGTMFVVAGTMGGESLYAINTADPDYAYFAQTMGAGDADASRGFLRFDLSSTQLAMKFVASKGTFTDTVTIN